jgi:ribosomal protein L7/L12
VQYIFLLASIALVFTIVIVGTKLQQEARAQVDQLKALATTIEGASETLASRIGRIADRTERVEKALLEVVERADAALSANGVDIKAYRATLRKAVIERVRELVTQGEKVSAMKLWRETTGIDMGPALDFVESIEREMGRTPS